MSLYLITGVVFCLIFLMIVLLGMALSAKGKTLDDRLRETVFVGSAREQIKPTLRPAKSIVSGQNEGSFLPKIGGMITSAEEIRESPVKLRLAHAGYSGDNAVRTFVGVKILLALLLPFVFIAVLVLIHKPLDRAAMWIAIFGGVGFFIPEVYLYYRCKWRQEQIFCGLPDALDLMVICVESGLGLDAALQKVADEIHISNRSLSEELNMTCLEIRAGRPRREALSNLAVRTGVPDVKALVAILVQAERFGTSTAHALRTHSDDMRLRRKQRAEEAAAKTAVKLVFPLVLFIFPAIFVVLAGPAMIRISEFILNR